MKKGDTFSDFDAWADKSLWPAIVESYGASGAPTESAAPRGLQMDISTQDRATKLRQDVKLGRVINVRTLTAPGEPEKRHLEIQLPSEMAYQPGDYLAILPFNPYATVRRVLDKYHLPWDAVVTIKDGGATTLPTNVPVSAFDLLKGYVELARPATKKVIYPAL
jgi:cytochrome P450/NADPH-cytochrome P450 reductase